VVFNATTVKLRYCFGWLSLYTQLRESVQPNIIRETVKAAIHDETEKKTEIKCEMETKYFGRERPVETEIVVYGL